MMDPSRFPTDDAPDGEGPELEVFFGGNLDWHVWIRWRRELDGLVDVSPPVRFSTSGGRNDTATMLVAALDAALRGDWETAAARAETAAEFARTER